MRRYTALSFVKIHMQSHCTIKELSICLPLKFLLQSLWLGAASAYQADALIAASDAMSSTEARRQQLAMGAGSSSLLLHLDSVEQQSQHMPSA